MILPKAKTNLLAEYSNHEKPLQERILIENRYIISLFFIWICQYFHKSHTWERENTRKHVKHANRTHANGTAKTQTRENAMRASRNAYVGAANREKNRENVTLAPAREDKKVIDKTNHLHFKTFCIANIPREYSILIIF